MLTVKFADAKRVRLKIRDARRTVTREAASDILFARGEQPHFISPFTSGL